MIVEGPNDESSWVGKFFDPLGRFQEPPRLNLVRVPSYFIRYRISGLAYIVLLQPLFKLTGRCMLFGPN